MKAHEEIMSDAKAVENEAPEVTPEIKVPRAKIRVASIDRSSSSPIAKITIRRSIDSPSRQQSSYEIITTKRDGENYVENALVPTVKLHRYDVPLQSPQEKMLNNGLDPMALELISSASMGTSKTASEYSDKSDESFSTPKISREMKNLQKSTNDSKILSNYLITSSGSPRSRRKTIVETAIVDELVQETIEKEEEEEEKESAAESDSTTILHPLMEPPEMRRKSISRSRSRSRNAIRGRKKSMALQLIDEVTSDKDETIEDEDEDMSEVSFITNRSIEGRAVNPPPKYPYWPAKVMSVDARQQVDVRFFGAHDRAWVPAAHCMLFSEKDPNKTKGGTPTNSKNTSKTQKGIADAMKEKDDYIENLRAKFGFKYAPFRQQFDPAELQTQLEAMLPNLKNPKEVKEGSEKEAMDGSQKEKLTLKIVKGQSSNYQVEHKSGDPRTPSIKTKPNLYKVLSKNDNNSEETDGKLIPLIIKRKSNIEQEIDSLKRSRTGSETSESSLSVQSAKMANASRRKSTRDSIKQKKVVKHVEPPVKKGRHADKPQKEDEEIVDENVKVKASRRRAKSVLPETDQPLLVSLVVPAGADEVPAAKEKSPVQSVITRTMKRSYSYNRSNDKEIENNLKIARRQSINISSPSKRSESPPKEKDAESKAEDPKPDEKSQEKPAEESFDPNLVIKDEPLSEGEEQPEQVEEESAFTLSDIPNLMQDKSGKKKLIVISTNEDNGETSSSKTSQQTRGRARKTFPNVVNQRQIEQLGQGQSRNGNWMVCIPQAFSTPQNSQPASNRSTPVSESQISIVQVRSNATSTPNSVSSAPSTSNRSFNVNPVPPLSFVSNSNDQRRNSVYNGNSSFVNGQHRQQSNFNQQSLPRLMPRPQGVFVNDGTSFSRDNGPVSRMFTDNAHRVTDYFRNLIMDSISAVSDAPAAENLMLRAEIERLQREMQTTKSDCQQKMQELRREHQDELETLKRAYEERIVNIQIQADQDKSKLIKEVRHQCDLEKQRAIEMTRKETKKTTWCSNCTKEARFYCCWNTSYCGQQCQKTHWQHHQKYCTNKNSASDTQQTPMQVTQQTNTDPQLVTVPVSVSRPALLFRQSPGQMPQQVQLQPPASLPQHIILPHRTTTTMTLPVISVCPNQMSNQILIAQQPYKNNNRQTIQTVYQEKPVKEALQVSPTSLTVQTIQRGDDSPKINVITTSPMIDPMIVRVNSRATTPTQE